ncbi:MAG: cyanophycin synthetase, partial [Patescibacteria group bacterium]
IEKLKEELKNKKVFTYGVNSNADVKAYNLKENNAFDSEYATGIEFDLAYDNQEEHINMKYVIGSHGVYALLVASVVGINMGMSLEEIKNELQNVRFEKGRMSVIKGVKNTWIIDDTYNSSPVACKSAVKTLSTSKNIGRKIAVLGDMLELGKISEDAHREIGKYICELGNIDMLVTVGERSRDINREALLNGFNEDVSFNFENSEEAKKFIQNRIKQDDLILIKGSQGVRMEKITKEIMADPIKAEDLLVRQSGIWKKK